MEWHQAFDAQLIKENDVVGVQVAGRSVALYKLDGRIYATDNICTHGEALLSEGWVDEGCIECPLHQGRFDIITGKGQGSPISTDLKTFPVKEENGWVFIEMA